MGGSHVTFWGKKEVTFKAREDEIPLLPRCIQRESDVLEDLRFHTNKEELMQTAALTVENVTIQAKNEFQLIKSGLRLAQ